MNCGSANLYLHSLLLEVHILHYSLNGVQKMNEKKYEKRLEFQQKLISRQSKQIDELKREIENLELIIEEKDEVVNSVDYLRKELEENVSEVKQQRKKYDALIMELKAMKNIINEDVYKKRWWLLKHFLK